MAKELNIPESASQIAVIENAAAYPSLRDPQNALDILKENLGGEKISEFDLQQIRVPAGGGLNWTIPTVSGETSAPSIEGIMVAVASRRAYWETSDPSGAPPDCVSTDMESGVGRPGGLCETCPMNAFGSAENGSGKGCKESRSVFLLTPGAQIPSVIIVPPGSLKTFRKFLVALPVAYCTVVVKFSLAREKNRDGISYAQIVPSLVGAVPAESEEAVRGMSQLYKRMFVA
jgi:hypothetical protein